MPNIPAGGGAAAPVGLVNGLTLKTIRTKMTTQMAQMAAGRP